MSMISGLIANLKDLIGQSTNEVSANHPDHLLKENRIHRTYTPVRYTLTKDSKLQLQPVVRNR
jgi:hypothetical protein